MPRYHACEHAKADELLCSACHIKALEEMVFEQREQRRYEIARDVMAALFVKQYDLADVASEVAVKAADALLRKLEASDGS